MKNILLVGLGGFLGSISRYKIGGWILHQYPMIKFPLSTFVINVCGCFIIGVVSAVAEAKGHFHREMSLFLMTGILGGFTTFSSFGYETIFLMRRGEFSVAFLNVILSVAVCLIAVWLGLKTIVLFRS